MKIDYEFIWEILGMWYFWNLSQAICGVRVIRLGVRREFIFCYIIKP